MNGAGYAARPVSLEYAMPRGRDFPGGSHGAGSQCRTLRRVAIQTSRKITFDVGHTLFTELNTDAKMNLTVDGNDTHDGTATADSGYTPISGRSTYDFVNERNEMVKGKVCSPRLPQRARGWG